MKLIIFFIYVFLLFGTLEVFATQSSQEEYDTDHPKPDKISSILKAPKKKIKIIS